MNAKMTMKDRKKMKLQQKVCWFVCNSEDKERSGNSDK